MIYAINFIFSPIVLVRGKACTSFVSRVRDGCHNRELPGPTGEPSHANPASVPKNVAAAANSPIKGLKAFRRFVIPVTHECPLDHFNARHMALSWICLSEIVKGGRHGQTRLSLHGVADVEPSVFHALGRHSPLPALMRGH